MTGHAQFPDDAGVQRRIQSGRDLRRDGHPAAGQTEHDDIASAAVRRQQTGQYAPRLCTVTKDASR
ncbi:hypothetical protein GCM10009856_58690 [Mycolicibacterium llatzerense]